jgi:glycosyltransferase involved in cell wall biosynthesis
LSDLIESVDVKCSIIMPLYNSSRWVRDTLQSIINQDFASWECVVINDGSTDDSAKIVEDYAKIDPRFKLITTSNKGTSEARNLGIEISKGDYLAFIDSDDLWFPSKLSQQITNLDKNIESEFTLCSYLLFVGPEAKIAGLIKSPKRILKAIAKWKGFTGEGPAAGSTLMMRSSVVSKVGLFKPELSSAADLEFLERIAFNCRYVPTFDCLVGYRRHDAQMHLNSGLVKHDLEIIFSSRDIEPLAKQRYAHYIFLLQTIEYFHQMRKINPVKFILFGVRVSLKVAKRKLRYSFNPNKSKLQKEVASIFME